MTCEAITLLVFVKYGANNGCIAFGNVICVNSKHIIEVARELGLTIPQPISIKDYKPFSNEKILVDDAEYVLAHLIGKIECMTLSKPHQ